MAANPVPELLPHEERRWSLVRAGTFPRLRVLAWHGDLLYASCGYQLLRAKIIADINKIDWQPVGSYDPSAWRVLSSSHLLSARLFRDGFHALAVLPTNHLIGAVPGAIITLAPGATEFRVFHKVLRGTRPLHITAVPGGQIFWGEYFDNPQRDEVHIYGSVDNGSSWQIAFTFPAGSIRHVHNIVHDPWGNCLWILTGDSGAECRILRASCDFKNVDVVLSGYQQARAVAMVSAEDGLYFSSDTPLERNHIYRLDRLGNIATLADLDSSSISGCRVGNTMFFSTMVEPSEANLKQTVSIYGAHGGASWRKQLSWKKDVWPKGLFQYGNAFLPGGHNATGILALTTIAVKPGDLETSLWRIVNE
ncbi:MAG TPA: hypothetical protein VH079_10420 [Terriglobales bacterium]|nr:hypothetical protein [Terriglobales bacterium]